MAFSAVCIVLGAVAGLWISSLTHRDQVLQLPTYRQIPPVSPSSPQIFLDAGELTDRINMLTVDNFSNKFPQLLASMDRLAPEKPNRLAMRRYLTLHMLGLFDKVSSRNTGFESTENKLEVKNALSEPSKQFEEAVAEIKGTPLTYEEIALAIDNLVPSSSTDNISRIIFAIADLDNERDRELLERRLEARVETFEKQPTLKEDAFSYRQEVDKPVFPDNWQGRYGMDVFEIERRVLQLNPQGDLAELEELIHAISLIEDDSNRTRALEQLEQQLDTR